LGDSLTHGREAVEEINGRSDIPHHVAKEAGPAAMPCVEGVAPFQQSGGKTNLIKAEDHEACLG
jgi:hypothetical protein